MKEMAFHLRPISPDNGVPIEASIPDVQREVTRMLADLVSNREPSTVLGVLAEAKVPLSAYAVAAWLPDADPEQIAWTLDTLAETPFVMKIDKTNGLSTGYAIARN